MESWWSGYQRKGVCGGLGVAESHPLAVSDGDSRSDRMLLISRHVTLRGSVFALGEAQVI